MLLKCWKKRPEVALYPRRKGQLVRVGSIKLILQICGEKRSQVNILANRIYTKR